MKQIFTKSGDKGTTSLKGGVRVAKYDLRIIANGKIDTLNSWLGLLRSSIENKQDSSFIYSIQEELMAIMSHIATPDGITNSRSLNSLELVGKMEELISACEPPKGFVIPGINRLSSFIHIARSTAREVELILWKLNCEHSVKEEITTFFNRLSDYLFTLAVKEERR